MHELISKIPVRVCEYIYLKDPESSDLGKKIISGSIEMIDELGFEAFTFRKLAKHIGSTEASVYRYFESKQKLLLYLSAWYWGWMEYQLVFSLANIDSPNERLRRAIRLFTEPVNQDSSFGHIDEVKLNNIVVSESSKAYLTKSVDEVNREGAFSGYKNLVRRVSEIVLELNPQYKYAHMLISTVIEGAHHQVFFAEHLPSLTDRIEGENSVTQFYTDMVEKVIVQKANDEKPQ